MSLAPRRIRFTAAKVLMVALLAVAALAGAATLAPPAQAANGCGPNDWRNRVVPEYPLGVNFHDACNQHDRCYGTMWYFVGRTPWAARKACDDALYSRVTNRCYVAYGASSFWRTCQQIAYLYWSKVRQHGSGPYRNAQAAIGLRV